MTGIFLAGASSSSELDSSELDSAFLTCLGAGAFTTGVEDFCFFADLESGFLTGSSSSVLDSSSEESCAADFFLACLGVCFGGVAWPFCCILISWHSQDLKKEPHKSDAL